jgi:TonB-linked SusC/RagA family outer membrane protein
MKIKPLLYFLKAGNDLTKILRIMRLITIMMIIGIFQVNASVYSQNEVFSFKESGLTMRGVFKTIERTSKFKFFFNDDLTNVDKRVEVANNLKINQVLDAVLAGTDLSYKILENNLVIISPLVLLQQKKITGVITDAITGQPLIGVSVKVQGTTKATVSDVNGKYIIDVSDPKAVLVYTYLGYETRVIAIDNNTKIDVALSQASKTLDEVVIVGVQRQTKRTTVSAISTVTSKEIENMPSPSVDALLQGHVAGLNVQITSGEPGIAPTVVVRGNSKVSTGINQSAVAQSRALSGPLYVIDGVPVNPDDINSNIDVTGTNYLAGININDIETVDVQKDASATAAWGSRGANGVIYIKTKKGKSPTPEFRINAYTGFVQRPELLKTLTGQAERAKKLDILNTYGSAAQRAGIPQMLSDSLNPSYNNATDWQGLFYRPAIVQNYDATISGAADNYNYRVSGNYYDEQGIIKSFGYKRISLRGNFDFKISSKLNSQLIISTSHGDRQRGMKYNNSDANTPVSSASMPSSFYKLNGADSLLFLGLSSQLRNSNINDTYNASLRLNYDILPSLKYSVLGSANISTSNRDYFQPSSSSDASDSRAAGKSSFAESDKGTYSTYYIENNLNYIKSFESAKHIHNLVLTASQQFSRDISNSNSVWGYNVPSNDIHVVSGIAQADLGGNSAYAASGLLSLLGQAAYDFDKKYMLSLTYRGDASSRFGSNNKWGYFPSAGAGWVVSDEKFMKKINKVVNFMKLRASYGESGTNSSDFYAPYNSYTYGGYYNGEASMQPNYTNGLTKNNLTWSKTLQKNIGVDLQLFNSKVTLSVDAYDRLTKDDFYAFDLPFFTGFDQINFNAKDLWVSNKGYEVTLSASIFPTTNKFQWNMQFVLAHNKNLIAKLPNNNRSFVVYDASGVCRLYSVGQPVYEMFQMHYKGVYNQTSEIPFDPLTGKRLTYFKGNHTVVAGDPILEDVNKDGDVWEQEDNGDQYGDRIPTGDPNPKFTGGFTNNFSYKNFSLSIISVFTYKRAVYNTYFQQQISNIVGGYSSSINTFAQGRLPDLSNVNYWTPQKAADPKYQAGFPSINPYGSSYYQYIPITDMFVTDGSYFKVKTISFGYRFNDGFCKKIHVARANVYAMIDNVLTLKNSSLPNPELVDELGVYTGGMYATPTKFTLGIDITF